MGSSRKAILFDLDGTLVESAPDLAGALNDLLSEKGWGQLDPGDVRNMIGSGIPKLVERAVAAVGRQVDDGALHGLVARYRELYAPRSTRLTTLFPGVDAFLRDLKDAGVALGVVTNKPEAISRQILDELGIMSLLGAVVGGDTTTTMKPDAAPVLAALEHLDCPPETAIMIGDSPTDAGAARAAGVPVILVTFGYSREPVREIDADGIVDSYVQLGKLLEQRGFLK